MLVEFPTRGYLVGMQSLAAHEVHREMGACFSAIREQEIVDNYGDAASEYEALVGSVGILDLSSRSRLCLVGPDRDRFLNGQITNDLAAVKIWGGCYAAVLTAKGRMETDLNLYRLPEELLLDFEPGLTEVIAQRFDHYVIADDVEICRVGQALGLLSVQGPSSAEVLKMVGLPSELPRTPFAMARLPKPGLEDSYVAAQPRASSSGFDLFVPAAQVPATLRSLCEAARSLGGGPCGWAALELLRIEAGIPRFGCDMDSTTLPPEAGLEQRAISYTKGCYIGQEIIARIRTYGHVARNLRGILFTPEITAPPSQGALLYRDDRACGQITSSAFSPRIGACIALAYVRREVSSVGTTLELREAGRGGSARIVELPFRAA